MTYRTAVTISTTLACAAVSVVLSAQATMPSPPAGFTALFNGKDLSGWRGRPGGGGVFSPYVEAKFTPEERAAKQTEWNDDRDLHWRVDAANGELVSDGKGVHLATEKPYGDFELRVDWMLTQPGGDSGIYLRDYPQVQLWDPANPREQKNGADKGSGGLWNNNPDNPGRWPLVKADNPIGEWNTLAIKMVGDARVGHAQRQAGRRRPGARQLLRSRAASAADRIDRAADARIGSALPQRLRARDSRGRRQDAARDSGRRRQVGGASTT